MTGAATGPTIRIGIDTGGTFTDVVAVDDVSGRLVTTKVPSTPADPADGFLDGIQSVLTELDASPADIASVLHGTTVATNQLLQGRMGDLGFVTNHGYRFLLEIARQSVPDGYGNSYFWVKPDRIVPVDRVQTVRGRLDHRGREIEPLNESDVLAAAEFFRRRGISTIGVSLLHAYANPAHEERVRELLSDALPDAVVSISTDVLPEYREYERAMTTLVDAAVKPTVARYVSGIDRRLRVLAAAADAPPPPFSIMRSNGGVLSARQVVKQPITTVLSGPAAGALGAALIADLAGHGAVLTCDGGGTSTDVAVVTRGQPGITTEGTVGGYPVRVPMVDVVTVGAGGGSIAWASSQAGGGRGVLKVGPASAGADPGPACYGLGGTDPTVTDAHLVLGRIPPHLLGGRIPLDTSAAVKCLDGLAAHLQMSLQDCALGVLEISAWNQANAVRQVTVKRGLDVRDFPMVTFGGSGSLLACRLMDILGIPAVLVPPDPGTVSAFGLLAVDVRHDLVRTSVVRDLDIDIGVLAVFFDDLTRRARETLTAEGFRQDDHVVERSADLRYLGQAFEVRVACPPGSVDGTWARSVVDAFHTAHEALYGYHFRGKADQHVEWVNLRVTGVGPLPRPPLRRVPDSRGADAALVSRRPVCFGEWVDAGIYDRSRLGAGDAVAGPAVIQEFGSTVPIYPGYLATVDPIGALAITATGDPR